MFYPLSIDLDAKQVLVIGGGKIGFHKGAVLSHAGAKVTLIAPKRIDAWNDLDVTWRKENYVDQALSGYFLVICATENAALNARVAEKCQREHILCDNTSAGQSGDVIFPAVAGKNGFTVAINSGGKTPFLTKKLKGDIERMLAPYNEEIIALLGETRAYIIEHYPAEKEALLQKLANTQPSVLKEKGNADEISHWLQRE